MADLKSIKDLAEEWRLSRGHLEAVIAFEDIKSLHSYKQGNGVVHLYDPDQVLAANERYVLKKATEEAAKAAEARKAAPLTVGDIEGLRAAWEKLCNTLTPRVESIQQDMTAVFSSAEDAAKTTMTLLEQNKLIFARLGEMQEMMRDRFGAIERMVGAYANAPAVAAGALDLGALKTDPKVLEKLAGAGHPAAANSPATDALPSPPDKSVAHRKEPSPVEVAPLRPRIVILGLSKAHQNIIGKEYSGSFDLRMFESKETNGASFVNKIMGHQAVFFMCQFMNDSGKNAVLDAPKDKLNVIRVDGALSSLKTALNDFWILQQAERLGNLPANQKASRK